MNDFAAELFPDNPQAAQAFREEFKEGETFLIDDNVCLCENYTIGERRCNCGNTRISVEEYQSHGVYFFNFAAC